MLYSEKYQVSLVQTSSRGFGGKYLDGCIVVSGTGLLGALVRSPEDPSIVIPAMEKMVAVRTRIFFVDMAYSGG